MKRGLRLLITGLLAVSFVVPAGAFHSHGETEPPVFAASAWAQPELMAAYEAGLLIGSYGDPALDYRENITRIGFCRMLTNYLAAEQNTDLDMLKGMTLRFLAERDEAGDLRRVFTDCADQWEEQDAAVGYYLGLIQGKGEGLFDPQGSLTRQEAAVMLARAQEILGGDPVQAAAVPAYRDGDAIRDWAAPSVAALQTWQVMEGREDGAFWPEDPLTVQECAVLCLRLHEKAPVRLEEGNVQPLFSYEQVMEHLEGIEEESKAVGTGRYKAFQLDGPEASLVRMDWGGSMQATSKLYFASRQGGILFFDIGLCVSFKTLTPSMDLENPRFSADGKTFFCEVTLAEDSWEYVHDGADTVQVTTHEAGLYHVTVDVATGQTQLTREDLPAR